MSMYVLGDKKNILHYFNITVAHCVANTEQFTILKFYLKHHLLSSNIFFPSDNLKGWNGM